MIIYNKLLAIPSKWSNRLRQSGGKVKAIFQIFIRAIFQVFMAGNLSIFIRITSNQPILPCHYGSLVSPITVNIYLYAYVNIAKYF